MWRFIETFFSNLVDAIDEFFVNLANACEIFGSAIWMIICNPSLLVPTFVGWIFTASAIVYFQYYYKWEMFPLYLNLLVVLVIVIAICGILSTCCIVVLERFKQIENGERASLLKAAAEAFRNDLKKALPIATVWSIILFVSLVMELFLFLAKKAAKTKRNSKDERSNSRKDDSFAFQGSNISSDNEKTASLENITKTLSGYNHSGWRSGGISSVASGGAEMYDASASIKSTVFSYFRRGLRFVMFFTCAAIILGDANNSRAVKQAFSLLGNGIIRFISLFFFTEIFFAVLLLPVMITLNLSDAKEIVLSDVHYIILIGYIGLAISFYFSSQQILAAKLYRRFISDDKRRGSGNKLL